MMATVPTFSELYDLAKAETQARRPDLTDYSEGSALDAITGAAAILATASNRLTVELFEAVFFDTAGGARLRTLITDRLGQTVLGMLDRPASAAVGIIRWTRAAAGTYTILAGTRFQIADGTNTIVVQTTAAANVTAPDTTVDIPVQALVTGRTGNVAAGGVWTLLDAVAADPTVSTASNPAALAGGADALTDEGLRAAVRSYYDSIRRGTVGALETGSKVVAGVTVVTVDELTQIAAGVVLVIIGDPDGNGSAPLVASVEAELVNWRAAGILVQVLAAAREVIPLTLTIVHEVGADRSVLRTAIVDAIEAYGDTINPGVAGKRSRIEAAAHNASDSVLEVIFEGVPADLQPSAPENAVRFADASIAIAWETI